MAFNITKYYWCR